MIHDYEDGDPSLLGYARVSTKPQHTDMQLEALRKAGCGRIYEEHASGSNDARPVRAHLLDHVRKGDTVVVWRLDRWGRGMSDLTQTIETLGVRGIGFKVLNGAMPFDTSTPDGKLIFRLFAAIAEFQRELTVENTKAGVAAARAKGRHLGRPRALDARKIEMARALRRDDWDDRRIAEHLGVHPVTIKRYLAS